jgi:hypothetical protein
MPINITVSDTEITYLNIPARNELEVVLTEYKNEILAEANRLEAANRSTPGTTPQVISSNIRDAEIIIRHRFRVPKKSLWLAGIKVMATLFGILAGLASNQLTTEWWGPYAFSVTISLAIIFTTAAVWRE